MTWVWPTARRPALRTTMFTSRPRQFRHSIILVWLMPRNRSRSISESLGWVARYAQQFGYSLLGQAPSLVAVNAGTMSFHRNWKLESQFRLHSRHAR